MSEAREINLTNQFLIAMPGMADDQFAGAVVYLCEHSDKGALGLVINRPIDIKLKNLFEKVELRLDREELAEQPVFFGGPVQTERGFVLHQPPGSYSSSLAVSDDIARVRPPARIRSPGASPSPPAAASPRPGPSSPPPGPGGRPAARRSSTPLAAAATAGCRRSIVGCRASLRRRERRNQVVARPTSARSARARRSPRWIFCVAVSGSASKKATWSRCACSAACR